LWIWAGHYLPRDDSSEFLERETAMAAQPGQLYFQQVILTLATDPARDMGARGQASSQSGVTADKSEIALHRRAKDHDD
jgi:hypothetical protein